MLDSLQPTNGSEPPSASWTSSILSMLAAEGRYDAADANLSTEARPEPTEHARQWATLMQRVDRDSDALPPDSTSPVDEARYDASERLGLRRFVQTFGRSIPVLGARETLLSTMSDLPVSYTVLAAIALGHCAFEGASKLSSQARIRSLSESLCASVEPREASPANALRILDVICSNLLMAYAFYGADSLQCASSHLESAIRIAQQHSLDLVAAGAEMPPTAWLIPQLTQPGRDMATAVWCEISVCDSMMSATTSGEIPRRLEHRGTSLWHLPMATSGLEALYKLRLQAALLMNRCIEQQNNLLSSPQSLNRVLALEGILVNLIAKAQGLWCKATGLVSAPPCHLSSAEATSLFDTAVLLNA